MVLLAIWGSPVEKPHSYGSPLSLGWQDTASDNVRRSIIRVRRVWETWSIQNRRVLLQETSGLSRIRWKISYHTPAHANLPHPLPLLRYLSNQRLLEVTFINFTPCVFVTVFILSGNFIPCAFVTVFLERENGPTAFLDSSENLLEQRHQGPAGSLVLSLLPQVEFLPHPELVFSRRHRSPHETRTAAFPGPAPTPDHLSTVPFQVSDWKVFKASFKMSQPPSGTVVLPQARFRTRPLFVSQGALHAEKFSSPPWRGFDLWDAL